MENSIRVSAYDNWIIIIDTKCRVVFDVRYPLSLASNGFKVKTFYILENLIYKNYQKTFLEKVKEYVGINSGVEVLKEHKIIAKDQWGETIIIQILENEIFNNTSADIFSLMNLKYKKYGI